VGVFVMPWIEILLSMVVVVVAFFTGLSSSPLYSSKNKNEKKSKIETGENNE
tara:strand:- start:222 stop:377 length:156 start_codon:yes stop_codon:yes gene_type:complete